jgi:hypothetical protein
MHEAARNVSIWRGWLRGRTYASLAREHGLSGTRTRQIAFEVNRIVRRYALSENADLRLSMPFNPENQWKEDALRGVWVEEGYDSTKPWSNGHPYTTRRLYFDRNEEPQ